MQVIFIISSLILFYYYFIYRNKLDIFTIAFLCCEFYFTPGFFGFTTRVFDDRTREYIQCSNKLYSIFILVILFLFIFTLFNGIKNKKISTFFIKDNQKKVDIFTGKSNYKKINPILVTNICSTILIVIIIIFLIVDGKSVFGKSKIEYMDNIGIIYQILRYLIPIVFAFAMINKNKFAYVVSGIGLSIDLYMSNRTVLLVCIITFVFISIYNKEKKDIYAYKKILIIVTLICVSFLVFERIIEPIQKKDWGELNKRISSVETYVDSIIVSEPFITQTILEEVIKEDYKVKENTTMNLFNEERDTFNDQFQPDLFPKITRYKMAENIWAEVYSNYSLGGVFIMAFMYSFVIYILNICILKFNKSIYLPYLYIVSANWIFFMHRGSVGNQLFRQKNIILVFGVCIIASHIFNILIKRIQLCRK